MVIFPSSTRPTVVPAAARWGTLILAPVDPYSGSIGVNAMTGTSRTPAVIPSYIS